ncbi:MAG TPA: CHAT domain-containing protein, partial [Anaerolineae bacterium]|nr:CHAT domain-containing protein [Anaerolineae bacterium]
MLDLEIHILPRTESGYPIYLRLGDGQDFAGNLAADLVAWTPTGNPQADGCTLFEALFASPKLREAWGLARSAEQRCLRLWLDADVPELHKLPWELLHDGQTFLAAAATTPFSRYLPSEAPWGGLVAERPIRILAVISNPADLAQYNLASLDGAAERALLTDALGDLAPKHFNLEFLEAPVTPERLERALATGPHVLHFVGHGAFGKRSQEAVLYLQDAAGNAQPVTDAQLCDMLRRQAKLPSLIFLAACQSAERSTVDAFAGLAPRLVQAGVPAVVAMQDKVALAATRKLTPVFYEELARHGEVDRALNAARSLLVTAQSPDAATPVLLMRLKDGKLWEPLWAQTNPYRGLAAFTEADAAFFFGREPVVQALIAQLRTTPSFLAVVGPSGSGKSSVVQAGLIPALRQGALYGSQTWEIVTQRPSDGLDLAGFENLAGSGERRVLFIDQFEELFQHPPEMRARFLAELHTLVESSHPTTVILTLRADFYGHFQQTPLREYLPTHQVNVDEIAPGDLRAAIEKPAARLNVRFEARLVETIVADAQQAAHPLPLLQSALLQMWSHQEQGTLTHTAYEAVGRVAGALGVWASDTYGRLDVTDQKLAQRIFTRLIYYGETDTRQRRTLAELVTGPEERERVHALVRQLANARLLVTRQDTVEIIHDTLLREWGRLQGWIAAQREFYLWRQRLEAQLRLWEDKGRDEGGLLHGALLAEAERWAQEQPEELNQSEQAYIAQ